MPTYEYRCISCKRKFTIIMSLREHDSKRIKCPKCGSRRISQLISAFYTQTSSKS